MVIVVCLRACTKLYIGPWQEQIRLVAILNYTLSVVAFYNK